jgi:hypothetical protein
VAEGLVSPSNVDIDAIRAALGSLPGGPTPAAGVIRQLADIVEPALVATSGPRYFGFVTGGALDAATAAPRPIRGPLTATSGLLGAPATLTRPKAGPAPGPEGDAQLA